MTTAELKAQLDSIIGSATAAGSITPTILNTQLKAMVDFFAVVPAGTVIQDSEFIAANGVLLPAYVPVAGSQWFNRLGTHEIQGNKVTTTGTGPWSFHVPLLTQNFVATIIMRTVTGAAVGTYKQIGIHCNSAESDGILINIGNTATGLYDIIGGTPTAGASWVGNDAGTENTYEITVIGTTMTVKRNTVTIFNAVTIASHSGNWLDINTGGSAAGDFTCESVRVVAA